MAPDASSTRRLVSVHRLPQVRAAPPAAARARRGRPPPLAAARRSPARARRRPAVGRHGWPRPAPVSSAAIRPAARGGLPPGAPARAVAWRRPACSPARAASRPGSAASSVGQMRGGGVGSAASARAAASAPPRPASMSSPGRGPGQERRRAGIGRGRLRLGERRQQRPDRLGPPGQRPAARPAGRAPAGCPRARAARQRLGKPGHQAGLLPRPLGAARAAATLADATSSPAPVTRRSRPGPRRSPSAGVSRSARVSDSSSVAGAGVEARRLGRCRHRRWMTVLRRLWRQRGRPRRGGGRAPR